MGKNETTAPPRRQTEDVCIWCGIRTAAVTTPPVWWEGAWYHRHPCLGSARLRASGYLPASYQTAAEWMAS